MTLLAADLRAMPKWGVGLHGRPQPHEIVGPPDRESDFGFLGFPILQLRLFSQTPCQAFRMKRRQVWRRSLHGHGEFCLWVGFHSHDPQRYQRSDVDKLWTDGGGVRGLAELLILERIFSTMEVVVARELGDAARPLLPSDFFDLIGGTST